MSSKELPERYFLARILWWQEAILGLEAIAVSYLIAVLKSVELDIPGAILKTDWQKKRAAALMFYCDELLAAAGIKTAETVAASAVEAGIASDAGIRSALKRAILKAAIEGHGYEKMTQNLLAEAVSQGQAITRREAITLARTYAQTANVEAQKAVYAKNSDVVYAQKWVSVLDNRVCPRCASLDGAIYKNGEQMPPVPLHPRCRCLLMPCVRVDELGVTSEDLEGVARPWVVREPGNIDTGDKRKILNYGSTKENFGGWYKTLPEQEQIRIVGPVRQRLLAEGKISFEELVDRQTGKLRTLAELGYTEGGKNIMGMPPKNDAQPGTPESIIKNAQAVNPNYGTGKGYDTNCQRCFLAYELRRRGHDVEAMPNNEKIGSGTSKRAVFAGWECFKDAKVEGSLGETDVFFEESQLLEKLRSLPEGARGGIIWTWTDTTRSHIIACEKLGGQLIFVDPQSGRTGPNTLGAASTDYGYTFFRTDNLDLDKDFEWNEIVRKKK